MTFRQSVGRVCRANNPLVHFFLFSQSNCCSKIPLQITTRWTQYNMTLILNVHRVESGVKRDISSYSIECTFYIEQTFNNFIIIYTDAMCTQQSFLIYSRNRRKNDQIYRKKNLFVEWTQLCDSRCPFHMYCKNWSKGSNVVSRGFVFTCAYSGVGKKPWII